MDKVANTSGLSRYHAKPTKINKITDISLKGYLKMVSTLEVQVYNQNRAISQLTAKYKRLGISKEYDEPYAPSAVDLIFMREEFFGLALGAGIALLISLFSGASWIGGCGIILAVLSVLPGIVEYKEKVNEYNKAVAAYQNAVSNNDRRVRHEIDMRPDIKQQISSISTELSNTRRALDALYSVNILHPSYRNLVAVCSFYDYLDKGICTKLTGHGGAYAFYEEALRFQKIETKLDIIINKLDEIIDNQQQLAYLIKEGNAAISRIEQQNNKMLYSMDKIVENTAVTEYNTRCAAQSLTVMENIALYRTLRSE